MGTSTLRKRWVGAWVAAAVVASTFAVVVAPAKPAEAAGVTTHGWMALEAIPLVRNHDLRALLYEHRHQVRAGAMLPDAGYLPGKTFGEEAHWQRFVDAYSRRIEARTDCGDVTDPHGPCAPMIAHVMGVAAHGLGDEVWDWLFEPYVPDLGEYFLPAGGPFNDGGAESQMDVVAIHDHHIPRPVVPDLPSLDTILGAFADVGRSDVTASQFDLVGVGELIWDLESSWVLQYMEDLRAAMPWTSANLRNAPGGVDFAAVAIAGMWQWMWDDLRGLEPTTTVVNTYPADGQIDVPASGWDRSIQPGTHPGRGGARTRVAAVLSYSRPYGTPASPYGGAQLPEGSFEITELSTGTPVPAKPGFPRSVPYGGEAGQKTIGAQPGSDLQPCTWYEASVSLHAPLTDARGANVAPHRWRFRTDDGSGGTVCPAGADELVGTVSDTEGNPVADVDVMAFSDDDGMIPTAVARTSADGAFHLPSLPTGEYRLAFVPPTRAGLALTWAGGSSSRQGATPVGVPGHTGSVDATLDPEAALSGTVAGPGGVPVAGALVGAFSPVDTWVPSAIAVTDESGAFGFDRLLPGPYRVYVVPPRPPLRSAWHGDPGEPGVRIEVQAGTPEAVGIDVRLPG